MRESLESWLINNIPDDRLIYRDGLYKQCTFVRDKLMLNMFLAVATDYPYVKSFSEEQSEIVSSFAPYVIGTHRSKSVLLPVMEIDLHRLGLKIILRHNFYDWCVSVESDYEIDCDFLGLLTDKKGQFEGFPTDRIYNHYSTSNNRNFSFVLDNKYELYTFMFLLKNHMMKNRNSSFGGKYGRQSCY